MNELQNLYEKINPADEPEVMAERIIARAEAGGSAKTRRPGRLALAACAAAALIAAVPMTASAMAGSNIFEVFKSYFNTQELNVVGMLEYNKAIELDGYGLTINGFAADKHCVFVSYDIEYKDESFFENGKLKQALLAGSSPVAFEAEPQFLGHGGGSAGGEKIISVDGATVKYASVAQSNESFLTAPFTDKYLVKISYTCRRKDSCDEGFFAGGAEKSGNIYVGIPAAKGITLSVNEEIAYQDGSKGVVKQIELNSLSVYVRVAEEEGDLKGEFTMETERMYMDSVSPKLVFKDGTVLDLAGRVGSHSSGSIAEDEWIVERIFDCTYGTVIDPETIEAVELFGKTYTVE